MAEHPEQQSNDPSSAEPQSQTERQQAGQQPSQPQVGQVPTNQQTRQQSVASPSTLSPLQRRGKVVAAVITLALCLIVGWLLWRFSFPWYVFVGLPALLLIIGVGYIFKWSWVGVVEYTSPPHAEHTDFQRSKTFWDWLQLLIIPAVLAAGAIGFSIKQNNDSLNLNNKQYTQSLNIAATRYVEDQQRALDQQQATTLQTYIDNIQDLLLNHNLLKSKPTDDVAILARARTLTALKGLDPERRGRLLIFIYEAQLIGFCQECIADSTMPIQHNAIIDLSGAYLVEAMLGDTLSLRGANLSNTDLYGAALYRADLRYANLTGADLRQANLDHADLRHAIISQLQLDGVYSCIGVHLPSGLTCHGHK